MEWLKMLDWSDHASKQAIATVIYCTDCLSIGTNMKVNVRAIVSYHDNSYSYLCSSMTQSLSYLSNNM